MRFRQTVEFLGSLKLAVVLLALATTVLIAATFYESRTSTAAVTAQVYRSWWFNALLGALAVNLAVAAALRWPWKQRHVGFVVTHAGLILILGGCSASFHFGTEGLMGLRVGDPPSNTVQLEERALIVMSPERTRTTLRVDRHGAVHPKTVALPGGLQLSLDEFWPNARAQRTVRDGGADWNPAVELSLTSATMRQSLRQWLVANDPEADRVRWGPALLEFRAARNEAEAQEWADTSSLQGLALRVVALPNHSLRYVASSRAGATSDAVRVGQPIRPGWMDWQVTVERFLTNAVVACEVARLPDDAEQPQPALRVTVRSGNASCTEWLLLGRAVELRSSGQPIRLMFGWDTLQLPFWVTLEDFVVERDEGGDHVAGWTSKVRFTNPVSGVEQRADIWMNHPAVFSGYKFSQASWDPQDLKYSVLQVKKDPLWVIALTWSGSALTIVGIGLMFYARGWLRA